MKNIIVVCAALLIVAGCKSKPKKGFKVELLMKETKDYCGGAPPSEEMMKEMMTPKPIENRNIYLMRFDENGTELNEIELKTNELGQITTLLEAGSYNIFYLSKKEQQQIIADLEEEGLKECFKNFFSLPKAAIQVNGDVEKTIIMHDMCNPCLPPAP
jgi:hypothetical protein